MNKVELLEAIKSIPEYQANLLPFKKGRSILRKRFKIKDNSIWDQAYSCFSTKNSKFLKSIIDGEYWYDLSNNYWAEKITTEEKVVACRNFLNSSQKRRLESLGELDYIRIKVIAEEMLLLSKYLKEVENGN